MPTFIPIGSLLSPEHRQLLPFVRRAQPQPVQFQFVNQYAARKIGPQTAGFAEQNGGPMATRDTLQ